MKKFNILLVVFLQFSFILTAQEKDTTKVVVIEKLERTAFECSTNIDNPTNILFSKNTLEIMMQHRFGLVQSGANDLVGFWAPSNIRIGLTYAVHDRLAIGYGTTKFNRLQDFNWKISILRQTRSNKIPVSVSYYGNFAIDARKKNQGLFIHLADRWSNFNQIIIAKRFSPKLSLQIAPSVSHYNIVKNTMRNDMVALAFGGRYKISDQTSVMLDYSQPITKFLKDNPHPGISLGFEFATSAHAFQLFVTNYNGILPQKNYMFNKNDLFNGQNYFYKSDFLFGFNITRNYNF